MASEVTHSCVGLLGIHVISVVVSGSRLFKFVQMSGNECSGRVFREIRDLRFKAGALLRSPDNDAVLRRFFECLVYVACFELSLEQLT